MIILISILGLFGCKPKKEKKENLDSWLETNFPQQMTVVSSLRDIHPKHFYEKKVTSLVADQKEPEAQFELVWYKDKPELGLSVEEVKTIHEQRLHELEAARSWFKKLTAAGLDKISVGVIDSALYILPYGEPDPVTRTSIIQKIFSVLKQEKNPTQTSIWTECMEDSAYRKEIQDIVPFGYWGRKDTYHDDHKIMSVDFEWTASTEEKAVNDHWAFNTKSSRSLVYMHQAFDDARRWADDHGEKAHYLEGEQMIQVELDQNDPLLVHYSFPLYASKPADSTQYDIEESAIGYITGVFDTDKKTFTKIKKVKEL